MFPYFQNYRWKNGNPIGLNKVENFSCSPISYRIVSDPYHKWISIEKYDAKGFREIVYDSQLLDFRKLHPHDQVAWQKHLLSENPLEAVYFIRNQDDRIVLKEVCTFEKGNCRSCSLYSPHGIYLSTHQLFYREHGDKFDGIVLYDREKRPVFYRFHQGYVDGEFTEVLKEEWEVLENLPFPKITVEDSNVHKWCE